MRKTESRRRIWQSEGEAFKETKAGRTSILNGMEHRDPRGWDLGGLGKKAALGWEELWQEDEEGVNYVVEAGAHGPQGEARCSTLA